MVMQVFNDFPEQPFPKNAKRFQLLNVIKSSHCGFGASVFERKRKWMGNLIWICFKKLSSKGDWINQVEICSVFEKTEVKN